MNRFTVETKNDNYNDDDHAIESIYCNYRC